MNLLHTPLVEAHEALGARMVPFAGWSMPVQYEGVVAEHLHTRSAAGLFDLSHMGRITVRGPAARDLLHLATTNDVDRLAAGAAQYTLMCNERGGIIEDLLVYRFADPPPHLPPPVWGETKRGAWGLVVNAVNRERVIELLRSTAAARQLDATVEDETFKLALIGVQGPMSEEVLQPLVEQSLSDLHYYHARWDIVQCHGRALSALISRTGYTGEDGFELVVDAGQAALMWDRLRGDPRARPAGLGARDTLRLEAGMALYGHELTEDVTPFEAGLGRVVKLDKGPFIGRDALLALKDEPRQRLVGLRFGKGAVPRAGFAVRDGGQDVGTVASGTYSPTLGVPIATAFVHPDVATAGKRLVVAIRDSQAAAEIVSLPFVPHRTRR